MKTSLREREGFCAEALKRSGVMISRPGEGHPQSDVYMCWGVCVGSHGGYAKTLIAAMRRCLKCCGIGKWWAVAPPEDKELLRTLFQRMAKKHLGRGL